MDPALKNIINSLTYEVGAKFIHTDDIERIAEAYAELKFADGYKLGYMDRSDEIYTHEMVTRYHEYIGKQEYPED